MNDDIIISKETILDIVRENKSNYSVIIKSKYPVLYSTLKNKHTLTFSESLYLWLNDKTCGPMCLCCNEKYTRFIGINNGYGEFCSIKCVNSSEEVRGRIKNTYLEKYGVNNISQNLDIKEKKKKIFLERYGVISPVNIPSVRKKANETLISKYGVNGCFGNVYVRRKILISKRKSFINYCLSGNRFKDVIPLFNYNTFTNINDKSLRFKCKKCDYEFSHHFKWGSTPICKNCHSYSSIEDGVFTFLSEYIDKNLIRRSVFDVIENRELDIYIPSLKLAIECDGLYWHSELGNNKKAWYHLDKTDKCEAIGIHLIHIFEDEWIFKSGIIKTELLKFIPSTGNDIVKDDCEFISDIPIQEYKEFLIEHHIQGFHDAIVKLGLKRNKKLSSILSLKPSIDNLGCYTIVRFNSNSNSNNDDFKLLFDEFVRIYSPLKVIFYLDRRWESNITPSIYENCGFSKIGVTRCNFWYMNDYKNRHHNSEFKGTSWNSMRNNGWDRIFDCGSIKLEWINNKII